MFKKYLLALILLILLGCRQNNSEWNPIFEDTGYDFLENNIERSLSLIDDAYTELKIGKEVLYKKYCWKPESAA